MGETSRGVSDISPVMLEAILWHVEGVARAIRWMAFEILYPSLKWLVGVQHLVVFPVRSQG